MGSTRKQSQSVEDKVIAQLQALPDRKKPWTEFEDKMIREWYPLKTSSGIARALGKTPGQIRDRAATLGVRPA